MKAEGGWRCAGEEPPGAYSTSTPLTLLPGTFGSAWSYTSVTFDLSSAASWADATNAEAASSAAAKRNRVIMVVSIVTPRRGSPGPRTCEHRRSRRCMSVTARLPGDEGEQVRVHDVGVRGAHAVRE